MKDTLHYFRFAITAFLIGSIINIIGAMFKISHWPNANNIIFAGFILQIISIIYAIVLLFRLKSSK